MLVIFPEKPSFPFGIASLVFWAVGYGFIFGDNGNLFVGMSEFFYSGGGWGEGRLRYSTAAFFVFQLGICGHLFSGFFWQFRNEQNFLCILSLQYSFQSASLSCHRSLDLGRRLACRVMGSKILQALPLFI